MKILLMTDMYYPYFNANGLCIDEIRKGLQEYNDEIHILCFRHVKEKKYEMYDGIYIHRVRPRIFFWLLWYYENNSNTYLGKIIYWIAFLQNKFLKLMFFYWHPLASPIGLKRYKKYAKNICKKYNIDIAVGQYVPLEAAYAVAQLRKTEKCKTILYVVDSFSNCRTAEKSKLVANRNWKWEQRLYPNVDRVINMECHRRHHEQARYNKYRDKMLFSDIPTLHPIEEVKSENYSKMDRGKWNIIFNGTISNPVAFKMLAEILQKKKKEWNVCLNIASKPSTIVNQLVQKYDCIKYMGYLSTKEMQNALLNADAILSVGVLDSAMIPSKLFVALSSGNKIIHIGSGNKDSCLQYLKKYENAYVADICDYNSEKSQDIVTGVFENAIKSQSKRIPYDEIEKIYRENTPAYTASLIRDIYFEQK